MIYSFYDVGEGARKGLGTYIILDHIIRAARAGLPYVYLGYWVEGSDRMAYKASFKPMERLGRDGWRPNGRARGRRGSRAADPAGPLAAADPRRRLTADEFQIRPDSSLRLRPMMTAEIRSGRWS